MTRVVVNRCYGGFGLSDEAYEWLIAHGIELWGDDLVDMPHDRECIIVGDNKWLTSFGLYYDNFLDDNRDHPLLVECVETLGDKANGRCARLEVVHVPATVEWEIEEYDGTEWVAEVHRTW